MSLNIKTIGVLTSGGDAPGMNAAVRAVVRTAIFKGMRVFGIRSGYHGLLHNDIFEMNIRSVSEIIHRGGTTLYTARSTEFATRAGVLRAKEVCEQNGIDALVVIGGDGTFRGGLDLTRVGIPCVGIPATIDNDIACSDYSIGFDTALDTAIEMVDRLRDTIASHNRCSVVEVMGNDAGHLAAHIGLSTGALATIVPEIKCDIDRDIIDRMLYTQRSGKKHFIIIVAEGCGLTNEIAEAIRSRTGIESRVTVLGHVQRGGRPTGRDRVMATEMGHHAVELLAEGKGGRVVAFKHGQIMDFDFEEALSMKKSLDLRAFNISNMISL